jgi:hypothetical protein
MIYTAPCVMQLMRAVSITRASGRGMGPGNRDFFGPYEMASTRQASAIREGPKKPHQKHYVREQGSINHMCIGGFIPTLPPIQNLLEINRKL